MPGVIPNETRSSRLLSLIATILVVAVLYLARVVLIPLALAFLLTFLLTPAVMRLQRAGLARIPAVLVVSVLSFGVISILGYALAVETISLAESLPQYRENIRAKVRAIATPGTLSRVTESIRQTTEDVIEASTQPATTQPTTSTSRPAVSRYTPEPAPATAPPPTLVELAEPRPKPFDALSQAVSPILGPLGTAGIIVVFVVFMLIQREDLRDRLIALSGTHQINLTTTAIDDAAKRVSRYLMMQFVVNLTYGIAAAIGLMVIGVPNALLWGILCVVLRYIPYVGPWLAAAMPILLSLAVFDDWTRPSMVIGLFVAIEVISNNVIEPWLYGSGTGISPMAILLSAVFWTWLWGVPGLVLATPLTVCVVVLGRHVPQMRWLVVMLGEEPGLPLPARVYQRLLAADHEEVLTLAQQYLDDHTLLQWYEDVQMPALSMAESDRHDGTLNNHRGQTVFTAMREVIEELGETTSDDASAAVAQGEQRDAATNHTQRPLILIVAAHDEADELAAIMLGQLLEREHQRVEVLPTGGLTTEASERAMKCQPAVLCISSMPPMAVTHARYMCKRLHGRMPDTPLVVCVWNASDLDHATRRMRATGTETVVGTFSKAIETLRM